MKHEKTFRCVKKLNELDDDDRNESQIERESLLLLLF